MDLSMLSSTLLETSVAIFILRLPSAFKGTFE